MGEKNFSDLEKIKNPDKKEVEKELTGEEIEQLGEEMGDYTEGLKERVKEIEEELSKITDEKEKEALNLEIKDLQEQILGLEGFTGDIDSGDFESITTNKIMSEKLETRLTSSEGEKEKKYGVGEYEGEKTLKFELLTQSVAEVLEIIKKEFPGVPLEELEISSGDEVFFIEKKKEE